MRDGKPQVEGPEVPREIVAGMWWKYERYEIAPGPAEVGPVVRPAPGARLERYDPWARYRETATKGSRGTVVPAYQELIAIGRRVEELAREGQRYMEVVGSLAEDVRRWCDRHGLLGLLPHQCSMIVLPPRKAALQEVIGTFGMEPPPAGWGLLRRAMGTLRTQHVRTSSGWTTTVPSWIPNNRLLSAALGPEPEIAINAPGGWALFRDSPYSVNASIRPIPMRYFAGLKADELPLPLTDRFWAAYMEPAHEILSTAHIMYGIAAGLASLTNPDEPEEPSPGGLQDSLNALLSPLGHMARVNAPGHRLEMLWPCTSLLAALALMITTDTNTPGRAWRRCPWCKSMFSARTGYDQRFCSARCRDAAKYEQSKVKAGKKPAKKRGAKR